MAASNDALEFARIMIAEFIANRLHDDNAEGGENILDITSIHHSDHAPNIVSIELTSGDRFTIMVNTGWVG